MAKITKSLLKTQLDSTINAPAGRKRGIQDAYNNLLDSIYTTEVASGLTVSASNTVSIEVPQPANTMIKDITVVCTSEASLGASMDTGFKVGTTAGSADVVTAVIDAINSDATVEVGKGSSTDTALTTALAGPSPLVQAVGAPYTATSRTLYCTVSSSAEANTFDDNTGEFTVAVTYIQL
jgi:hypothetical protein